MNEESQKQDDKELEFANTNNVKRKLYSRVSSNRTASIKSTKWKTRFLMACKEGQFDVVKMTSPRLLVSI